MRQFFDTSNVKIGPEIAVFTNNGFTYYIYKDII